MTRDDVTRWAHKVALALTEPPYMVNASDACALRNAIEQLGSCADTALPPAALIVYGDGDEMRSFVTQYEVDRWIAQQRKYGSPYTFTTAPLYTAEQVEQIRRETVEACAREAERLAEKDQPGAALCRTVLTAAAIRALK